MDLLGTRACLRLRPSGGVLLSPGQEGRRRPLGQEAESEPGPSGSTSRAAAGATGPRESQQAGCPVPPPQTARRASWPRAGRAPGDHDEWQPAGPMEPRPGRGCSRHQLPSPRQRWGSLNNLSSYIPTQSVTATPSGPSRRFTQTHGTERTAPVPRNEDRDVGPGLVRDVHDGPSG